LKVELTDAADAADVKTIVRGLVAYNDSRAQPYEWKALTLLLRDEGGAIVGGLDGHTAWKWLFVRILWVAEAHQRKGYGRTLMEQAHAEAKRRGCVAAHLDTFDFQALDFYRGLGYSTFGELTDYPPGHARYFLQKRGL
jgi:GNAT superfamily N-acetyltransferase